MKKYNYIFIVIMILIILLGDVTLIRQQKELSTSENRSLQKFEHFTINTYLDSTYQSSLENALSDQFIGAATIKEKFKSALKFFNYNDIPKFICSEKYVNLDGEYYNYNCDDALILKYETMSEDTLANIKQRLNIYNNINNYTDTYYYFISTPSIYNFEKNEYKIDMISILKENLNNSYKLSALEFNDYEEYINLFYKTDHHWNYKGSYEGYKDIISMMLPNEKVIEPIEETSFNDIFFYGSAARVSQIFDYKEKFKVYKFDYPDMDILNNRSSDQYGNENEYSTGNYPKDKLAGHYGEYYGGDSGEVIFDTNDTKKGNILILGSSFTNPINKLIASHFNKTYVIDLRHYEELTSEIFNIKKYIDENKIDKVLIIMDYGYLKDQSFNMDWSN